MTDELIPPNVDVYRVTKPTMTIHVPHGAVYPTWDALSPSSEDKKRKPVRVSVWDSRKTTAFQAADIRIAASVPAPSGPLPSFYVFSVETSQVMRIGSRFKNEKLRVVSDPDGIVPVIASMPGVDGHSGIEGLERDGTISRLDWKDMLIELASLCRKVMGD